MSPDVDFLTKRFDRLHSSLGIMMYLGDYLLLVWRTNIVIGFLNAFPTAFTQ